MKIFILITLLFTTFTQNNTNVCVPMCIIEGMIENGKPWDEILIQIPKCKKSNYKKLRKIRGPYLSNRSKRGTKYRAKNNKKDVKETIRYLKKTVPINAVDSFFIKICNRVQNRFPYETAGTLKKEYYQPTTNFLSDEKNNISPPSTFDFGEEGINTYHKILQLDPYQSISLLIPYLDNNAATRCVYRAGVDICDPVYYLSISDVAMELIEMLSYCDFFDKENPIFNSFYEYTNPHRLYSDMSKEAKEAIKNRIINVYLNNKAEDDVYRISQFLENTTGPSFLNTCKNLKFLGHPDLAEKKLLTYYTPIYSSLTKTQIKKIVHQTLNEN